MLAVSALVHTVGYSCTISMHSMTTMLNISAGHVGVATSAPTSITLSLNTFGGADVNIGDNVDTGDINIGIAGLKC